MIFVYFHRRQNALKNISVSLHHRDYFRNRFKNYFFDIKNHKKCFNTARSFRPNIGLSNKSNECFDWSELPANEKLGNQFGSEATAEQIFGS